MRVGGDYVKVTVDENGYDGGNNARVKTDDTGAVCGEVNGNNVEYGGC